MCACGAPPLKDEPLCADCALVANGSVQAAQEALEEVSRILRGKARP